MNSVSVQHSSLQIDDYLDLLNLANKVEDHRWKKEIIRKLERLNHSAALPEIHDLERNHINH